MCGLKAKLEYCRLGDSKHVAETVLERCRGATLYGCAPWIPGWLIYGSGIGSRCSLPNAMLASNDVLAVPVKFKQKRYLQNKKIIDVGEGVVVGKESREIRSLCGQY